jgi:hypothetical protein
VTLPNWSKPLLCVAEVAQLSPTSSTFFLAIAVSTIWRIAEHIRRRKLQQAVGGPIISASPALRAASAYVRPPSRREPLTLG